LHSPQKIPKMPALVHQRSMHSSLRQFEPPLSRSIAFFFSIVLALVLSVMGCQPDESPLKSENETLHKQADKQESVIVSLQEGNKVMQQQIDLLSKELREARQQVERVMGERATLTTQLDEQENKTRKLAGDAQRVAEKAAQLNNAVRVDDKGAASEDVPAPLAVVVKALEDALSKNGYGIRAGIKTEQKAVYVTDRKVSEPTSLEVAGFRNQYVVYLQALAPARTRLSVKAEFERMAQGNRVLSAGAEEASEIERRLIMEISKALSRAGKV
jgi:TolA-binding protein